MVESQSAGFNLLPFREAANKFSALRVLVHDPLGAGAPASVD